MPVGPRSKIDYVRDTVASFIYHFNLSDSVLLILDDTRGSGLVASVESSENVRIIEAQSLLADSSKQHNTRGMLFIKQVLALRLLSREFEWRCLLRLDDDALVIGPNPHLDALAMLSAHPQVGMLGAYLRRGDGQDKRPALRKQGRRLIKRLMSRDIIRHPSMVKTLLMLIFRAKLRGYKLGDMCTGGSLFLSGDACIKIDRLFGDQLIKLQYSDLADDLLLALCVGAAGLKLKDFSDRNDIMAINWRGLPMPLDELTQRKKKLVHPVKDPENQSHEIEVREYFRAIRLAKKL